jgi:hypothetical protein
MRSVFLVETPLQMLNAIEARFSLPLGDCELVLILSDPFPRNVFAPLLRLGRWSRVHYFYLDHKPALTRFGWLGGSAADRLNEYLKEFKQLLKRFRFDRLSRGLGTIDNVVLGNFLQAYMQHFANLVRASRTYVVDDGTDTLRVNGLRQERSTSMPSRTPSSLIRSIKDRARHAFIDWDTAPLDSVTFFSSYNLNVGPQDKYVKNGYAFWRRGISHCQET